MTPTTPAISMLPLSRLDRLLEREVLRLRARYQLSLDEFRGLYVSDEQVDRLLADAGLAVGSEVPAALADARPRDVDPRWAHVVGAFALSTLQEDLLLIALAPELDLKYETLYAYLNNDVTRKWPTTDLARRLLVAAGTPAGAISAALASGSSLVDEGLIELLDVPEGRPSQLNAGFALHPSLARYLCGLPRAGVHAARDSAPDDSDAMPIDRLAAICAAPTAPVLVMQGQAGDDQAHLVASLAHRLDLPLCTIDLAAARRHAQGLHGQARRWRLEQRLQPALLHVHGIAALLDNEGRLPADLHGLLEALPAPLLLSCAGEQPWRELLGSRRVLPLSSQAPDFQRRRQLWQRHAASVGHRLDESTCATLADRFALDAWQIRHAVACAGDLATLRGTSEDDPQLLHDAAQMQSQSRLGSLASRAEARHGWDDLVLPPAALARLHEIAAAIDSRHRVYADWGFAHRIAGGTGIKALFAGASGTGKTMAAGVIAREVGLELYRIDLSGVVSKYIGETEKNLDRVFEAARAGNAILFFDEADAIFGKRSEVKDAHDRYANIETAYLLQKLEAHDGVVILASNLKRNIDEAFARRMHHVIDFPQPDVAQRERLWHGMFPAEAPLADDIDFAFLARSFEFAGGDIRNVVLDAAFIAARDGQRIGMRHLVRALTRQLGKQGRTPSPSDFQRYFALTREDDLHLAGHAVPSNGHAVRWSHEARS